MENLRITEASFELAFDLKDCFAEALLNIGINLDEGVLDGEVSEKGIETLVKSVLAVSSSKKVRNALFACCQTVLYGQDKVDRDFFMKVENRKLYYPIMIEVAKANISPFFEGLASMFGGLSAQFETILKQKLGNLT